ncbi:hypothetical protein F3Y22_tig00110528pilonHSYRG00349 [Hibiscus syriacus]|uniref:Uncharacterized protein n=1 Tax=Hibiscus syriacus TaxID=106335 RepID=A0A6A3AD43_HIBSY|nr:hypothetical protein F3Y22_tig00110528pilonHSYRG00349 [Hibiscus syriacus]
MSPKDLEKLYQRLRFSRHLLDGGKLVQLLIIRFSILFSLPDRLAVLCTSMLCLLDSYPLDSTIDSGDSPVSLGSIHLEFSADPFATLPELPLQESPPAGFTLCVTFAVSYPTV